MGGYLGGSKGNDYVRDYLQHYSPASIVMTCNLNSLMTLFVSLPSNKHLIQKQTLRLRFGFLCEIFKYFTCDISVFVSTIDQKQACITCLVSEYISSLYVASIYLYTLVF